MAKRQRSYSQSRLWSMRDVIPCEWMPPEVWSNVVYFYHILRLQDQWNTLKRIVWNNAGIVMPVRSIRLPLYERHRDNILVTIYHTPKRFYYTTEGQLFACLVSHGTYRMDNGSFAGSTTDVVIGNGSIDVPINGSMDVSINKDDSQWKEEKYPTRWYWRTTNEAMKYKEIMYETLPSSVTRYMYAPKPRPFFPAPEIIIIT